jgi:chromosome segregation ATPase
MDENSALERQLDTGTQKLGHLEKRLNDLQSRVAELTDLRHQIGMRKTALAESEAALTRLQPLWQAANHQMFSAVEQVRQAAQSTGLPSITVPKGEVLTNVKVRNIGPQSVTLEHDSGMSRVSVKELPSELEDRLQLEWWPALTLPAAPLEHPAVAAVQKMFAVPFREVFSEPKAAPAESEAAVASNRNFQASVVAIRTELSKLRIALEETNRQIAYLKGQEALAGNKGAKSLTLQRGMDVQTAQRQISVQRGGLEAQTVAVRARIKILEAQLAKLYK